MGRGQTPQFRTKPICPKKGRQEFRANEVLNVLHGVRALLQQKRALDHPTNQREPDPRKVAANLKAIATMQRAFGKWPSDKKSLGAKVSNACRYIHNMNEAAITKLRNLVDEEIRKEEQEMQRKAKESYHQWVAQALENGAGQAHRWCVQQPKAPPLPLYIEEGGETLYHPVDKAHHYKEMWEGG